MNKRKLPATKEVASCGSWSDQLALPDEGLRLRLRHAKLCRGIPTVQGTNLVVSMRPSSSRGNKLWFELSGRVPREALQGH